MNKIEIQNSSQNFYDSFNEFIMSNDNKVFNKLVARSFLMKEVENIPGDIVECGVFKGTGIYTFLKLRRLLNANSLKRVIGFDFFDTDDLINKIQDSVDKSNMSDLFTQRNFSHNINYKDYLENKLIDHGFHKNEFELVAGDISITSEKYKKQNPGFKISLLYIDLDIEEPTYNTLKNLYENVTKGGLIVFDEYAHPAWSESKGVDRFLSDMNLEIHNLNYGCPTAYIKK